MTDPKSDTLAFFPFPKMARLSRDIVVTEKLDGTNAQVHIQELGDTLEYGLAAQDPTVIAIRELDSTALVMRAGSRTKWITPAKNGDQADNYGFAGWVKAHADDLFTLGAGQHFGEWWGKGIQRGYGKQERNFSLFNVHRWGDPLSRPECCDVVPTLYRGVFDTDIIGLVMQSLERRGSSAAPGFMDPEGVIIFHTASGDLYKKTIKDDEAPKSRNGLERALAA